MRFEPETLSYLYKSHIPFTSKSLMGDFILIDKLYKIFISNMESITIVFVAGVFRIVTREEYCGTALITEP